MQYDEKTHKNWEKAHRMQKAKDSAFENATIVVSMIGILAIMIVAKIIETI